MNFYSQERAFKRISQLHTDISVKGEYAKEVYNDETEANMSILYSDFNDISHDNSLSKR
jgi:hypothetical protein